MTLQHPGRSRRLLATLLLVLLLAVALIGCGQSSDTSVDQGTDSGSSDPAEPINGDDSTSQDATDPEGDSDEDEAQDPDEEPGGSVDWTELPLVDVVTGETFTISELKGTQVFIQAFAVW